MGRDNDLPFVQMVDAQENSCPKPLPYAGMFVKDADKPIIKDLKAKGLLFKTLEFEHSYPYCWRCDTPLLYYARQTWFIRMTAVKDKLIENNRKINWIPETIKRGQNGEFPGECNGLGSFARALLGHAASRMGMRMRAFPCSRQPGGADSINGRTGKYRAA